MIPDFAVKWVVGAVLAAALAGFGAWQKHAYDERRREEGRAELLPQLEADKRAFDEIAGYMQTITANSTRLKQRVTAAERLNTQRQTVETERVKRIEGVVPTGETECLRTTDAIQKVLR